MASGPELLSWCLETLTLHGSSCNQNKWPIHEEFNGKKVNTESIKYQNCKLQRKLNPEKVQNKESKKKGY